MSIGRREVRRPQAQGDEELKCAHSCGPRRAATHRSPWGLQLKPAALVFEPLANAKAHPAPKLPPRSHDIASLKSSGGRSPLKTDTPLRLKMPCTPLTTGSTTSSLTNLATPTANKQLPSTKCFCDARLKPSPVSHPVRHECKGDGPRNPWNLDLGLHLPLASNGSRLRQSPLLRSVDYHLGGLFPRSRLDRCDRPERPRLAGCDPLISPGFSRKATSGEASAAVAGTGAAKAISKALRPSPQPLLALR